MYEYKQIIYRLKQGQSIRAISQQGLASRDKISGIKKIALTAGWLLPENLIPDEHILQEFFTHKAHKQQSEAIPYEDIIRPFIQQNIKARRIYQYLRDNHNFTASYNSVQRFMQKLKQKNVSNLTVPLHFEPGEAAQVDFGKGPDLFDERTQAKEETWFFVMTLCWSRHQYAKFVTHQDIETWLECHKEAFYWFCGVPSKIIIDNPKCAITKACYYDPQVQRSYEAFSAEYGFIISACPPREPKKKGRVESGVKFVKGNFMPLREFKSIQDANRQLTNWVLGAGSRIHGSTFKMPLIQFTVEKPLLKALPQNPVEIALWRKVLLYKDCHIRYLKSYYSAPYQLYNKELWIKVTSSTVTIYHQHEIVAVHPRLFIAGKYSTVNDHLPPRARWFLIMNKDLCIERSKSIGNATACVIERLLSDKTKDLLRTAQGIIKLEASYSSVRLESACKRAIHFNIISYKCIKQILESGADYIPIADNIKVPDIYKGSALFQRQIGGNNEHRA